MTTVVSVRLSPEEVKVITTWVREMNIRNKEHKLLTLSQVCRFILTDFLEEIENNELLLTEEQKCQM